MIIHICHKEASERLNLNNTVQAKRSAVTDNQHLVCILERCDLAYVPIADKINSLCKDFVTSEKLVLLHQKQPFLNKSR